MRILLRPLVAACLVAAAISPAAAQEAIFFPAVDNVAAQLVASINAESVRIDMSVARLNHRAISQALVNRHNAGVRVRLIGDAYSLFQSDSTSKAEFYWLANQGVPIRLRHHPTWYPEVAHWKATIFAGQNIVFFGSTNYTTNELMPTSSTNYTDGTVMRTGDFELVNAFKGQFDRMWNDTTRELGSRVGSAPYFLNWNDACAAEPKCADYDTLYPVRIIIEPTEYQNTEFPEFWLTRANIDRLHAAGVPIKTRAHQGLTRMTTLTTQLYTTVASSNMTTEWQRDHNYFVSPATKPAVYTAIRNRFTTMWNNTSGFVAFAPVAPQAPQLELPVDGATGVSTNGTLVWRRAAFATVNFGPAGGSGILAITAVNPTVQWLVGDSPGPSLTPFRPSWILVTPTSGSGNFNVTYTSLSRS